MIGCEKIAEGPTSETTNTITPPNISPCLRWCFTRQIGSVLARNGFNEFRKGFDYSEYGGAPLLGVKGVCIICHGRSNANAIKNAIRVAADYARGHINERIEEELAGAKL